MQKAAVIAAKELLVAFRDLSGMLFLFVTPIVVIAIASFALSNLWNPQASSFRVPLVQMDNGRVAEEVVKKLKESGVLVIETTWQDGTETRVMDLPKARSLLTKRKAAIVIPEDFSRNYSSGKKASILVLKDPADRVVSSVAENVVASVLAKYNMASVGVQVARITAMGTGRGLPQETVNALQTLVEDPPVDVRVEQGVKSMDTREPTPFESNVPGYAVMFVLFGTAFAAGSILQEKEEGTLKRVLTLPVSGATFLAGKLLANFTQAVLQTFVLFAAGHYFFGMWLGKNVLALVIFILITCFAATGLGILLAALCKTRSQLTSLAVLVVLSNSALGGSWWPLYIVPEWMQKAAHLTLTAWAMDGFNSLLIYGQQWEGILKPALVLMSMGLACFFLAAQRLKRFWAVY